MPSTTFPVRPIGYVRSTLRSLSDAPKQGNEGAPEAWLEIEPEFEPGLKGLMPGSKLLLLTWLHLAQRDLLQVHPRDDPQAPLTGVFRTRSADRPNPIGLHPVTLLGIEGRRLRVEPLEVLDGTPLLDLKPAL